MAFPEEYKLILCPELMVMSAPAEIIGKEFTVTTNPDVPLQPAKLLPVTEYIVVIEGFTVIELVNNPLLQI